MRARADAPTRMIRFGGLEIAHSDDVLEPRPWTILQSEWAAELAAVVPPGPILEICCGAGHIGLAAALATGRSLLQVDADPVACELARRNADAAGIGDRVHVACATIDSLSTRHRKGFPLILADPPYLRSEEVARFPEDPVSAIDGGPDGFALVGECIDLIADLLSAEGRALLQLGRLDRVDAVFDQHRGSVRPIGVRSCADDRNVVLLTRCMTGSQAGRRRE